MKCKLVVNLLTATLIITPVLVGCKRTPQRPTPLPGYGSPVSASDQPGNMIGNTTPIKPDDGATGNQITGQGIPQNPEGPHIGWIPDTEAFKAQTVYFDFDKSTVKASERPKLEEVARRMKSEYVGKALQIEGHCDERGTEGYNQALGERRALAVREMLVQYGLSPNIIETISYGEDRPAVPGHNEAAWSKNRRGVIVLLSPPDTTASK